MVSDSKIIKWLLSFIKDLQGKMLLAVTLGVLSYCSVIAIPMIGAFGAIQFLQGNKPSIFLYGTLMIGCGILRGVLRYGEQYQNHDIAFRLLAIVRDKVYKVLRELAPAKLANKQSGDLIAMITSDVELLEVFFAHTVSPVCIAGVMTVILLIGFVTLDIRLALLALVAYLVVGVVIPLILYRKYRKTGDGYKVAYSELNQTVIETTAGLNEINAYHLEDSTLKKIETAGRNVNNASEATLNQGLWIQNCSEIAVVVFSFLMLMLGVKLDLPFQSVLLSTILLMSSFGPFLALSGLGNALLSTLASGRRLYQLVHEEPAVNEVVEGEVVTYSQFEIENVHFSYPDSNKSVLEDLSLQLPKSGVIGLSGPSGIGKTTLLQLMMRFWDVEKGKVEMNRVPLSKITTHSLRENEGYMSQSTFLFEETIRFNVTLGKQDEEDSSVIEALKKASLGEWLERLPEGLDTKIGGKARQLSEGEKQRIGLARIFLRNSPLVLLDEPTSNLDYFNERIVLSTLDDDEEKLYFIVSHRDTTLQTAKEVIEFKAINTMH